MHYSATNEASLLCCQRVRHPSAADLARAALARRVAHNGASLRPCSWCAQVADVQRETRHGFARGQLLLQGLAPGGAHASQQLRVAFQNELLVAWLDGRVAGATPDLICCLDLEGGPAAVQLGSLVMHWGAGVVGRTRGCALSRIPTLADRSGPLAAHCRARCCRWYGGCDGGAQIRAAAGGAAAASS
jgi:hypothetical protein